MNINDLDNIKISKDLNTIVNSAVKTGSKELKSRKHKNIKYRVTAAPLSLILLGGIAFNNEKVFASIETLKSALDNSYFKVNTTLSNSLIPIRKQISHNDISLTVNNLLVDHDELILEITSDFSKLSKNHWKLNNISDLDSEINNFLGGDTSEDSLNFKKAIKDIYLGKEINEDFLQSLDENIRSNHESILNDIKLMYQWGISKEGFFYGRSECKNKAGAKETIFEKEDGTTEVQYFSILPRTPLADYSLLMNDIDLQYKSYQVIEYLNDEETIIKSLLSFNIPDNTDLSKDLNLSFKVGTFELDSYYPVKISINSAIDFTIPNNTLSNVSKVIPINKNFASNGLGNVTIENIILTPISLNINYKLNDKSENDPWRVQQFDVFLDDGTKLNLKSNNTVITKDFSNYCAKFTGDFIKEQLNGSKIKIVPNVVSLEEKEDFNYSKGTPIIISLK